MRNIRKILVRLLVVVLFVALLEESVQFLYRPYDRYFLYANREYKEEKGKIDTLFLGTSHTYFGMNPAIFNEELGVNSFNMATGAQSMFVSWQLFQEAVDINPLESLVYGVSFTSLLKDESDATVLSGYERLITWKGRLRFLMADKDNTRRMNELFYSTRVTDYFDFENVKENVTHKLAPDYWTTKPTSEDNWYEYRGYRGSYKVFSGKRKKKNNSESQNWSNEKVSEENLQYLKNILELASKKGIQVYLVMMPMTEAFMEDAGATGEMHDFFQELADEYGAILFDFVDEKGTPANFPNEYFRDMTHLNSNGAAAFSKILCSRIKEVRKESEE